MTYGGWLVTYGDWSAGGTNSAARSWRAVLGGALNSATISRAATRRKATLGWVAAISVSLSSFTCSAWASLATPIETAMRLSGLTARGFTWSNSACLFLFSQRVEGLASEVSPCYGLGTGEGAEAGATGTGTDGLEGLARDLQAGGGVSCSLKLDIYEENK